MTTSKLPDKMTHCPALITIKAISGKWKTRILWLLRTDEFQFNELRRRLGGVSAKVLSEHLQQLEQDGIVYRHQSQDGAVSLSHFGFTDYGKTLIPVLDALGAWGIAHSRLDTSNS